MHRLDHISRQLADSLINLFDPFTFGPQDRIAKL
jgi:hypothetical protein